MQDCAISSKSRVDVPDQHQSIVNLFRKFQGSFAVADTVIIKLVFVLSRNYGFTRPQKIQRYPSLLSLFDELDARYRGLPHLFTQKS